MTRFKKDPLLFIATAFILFMVFSFVGWIYEMSNDAIVRGGWHWRASLAGPWCPIYGIGGLLIVGMLGKYARVNVVQRNKTLDKASRVSDWMLRIIVLSLEIYLLVTLVELAGSYICEWTMGYMPWDYSTSWGNFEGRIAPGFTIRFVIGGLFFLYLVEPVIVRFTEKRRDLAITIAVGLLALFVVDNVLETVGVWNDVIPRESEVFVLPE